MNKNAQYKVKGMCRDTSESSFSQEYAFDIKNLRITAQENSTQLSLETERGNTLVDIRTTTTPSTSFTINGTVIGQASFTDRLILFCTTGSGKGSGLVPGNDYIYSIKYNGTNFIGETLYSGYISLSKDCPIETLSLYENSNVQKVYWTDGENQPRVINLTKTYTAPVSGVDTQFDFLPTLALGENITVTRVNSGDSMFPGGTLQYCITYSNRNGQESAIAWVSPLLYTSFQDRAVSPEEYSTASYTITITSPDTKFDCINLYSIIRTSENGIPIIKLVNKVGTSEGQIVLKDTNTTGEIVDSTSLLYKGSENLSCATMVAKDNTLFLGNLIIKNKLLNQDHLTISDITINTDTARTLGNSYTQSSFYNYTPPQVANNEFKYLRRGNYYRLGIQFQDTNGKWTDPVYVTDIKAGEGTYSSQVVGLDNNGNATIPTYKMSVSNANSTLTNLYNDGFRKARAVIVFPNVLKRGIIAQGVLNSTLFTPRQRKLNAPYAQASWFFRPYNLNDGYTGTANKVSAEGRNLHVLGLSNSYNSELQYMDYRNSNDGHMYADVTEMPDQFRKDYFYVDNSIVNLYSPDFEDLNQQSIDGASFRITGYISIDSLSGSYNIAADAPSLTNGFGVITDNNIFKRASESKDNILLSKTSWHDGHYGSTYLVSSRYYFYYLTYPWHKNGYIGVQDGVNPSSVIEDIILSKIQKKSIANLRISQRATYITPWTCDSGISNIRLNEGDTSDISTLNLPQNAVYRPGYSYDKLNYSGGYDNIITPTVDASNYRGYYIFMSETKNGELIRDGVLRDDGTLNVPIQCADPIRIRYKTSPHVVFGLNYYSNGKIKQLPIPYKNGTSYKKIKSEFGTPFWLYYNNSSVYQSYVATTWVAEICSNQHSIIQTYIRNTYDEENCPEGGIKVGFIGVQSGSPGDHDITLYTYTWEEQLREETELVLNDVVLGIAPPFAMCVGEISMSGGVTSVFKSHCDYFISSSTVESETTKVTLGDMDDNIIEVPNTPYNEILWLGELYRTFANADDVFGDHTNNYILNQLQWMPAGNAVLIPASVTTSTVLDLPITTGDSVFDRWDCIKTLPISSDDVNQVVDVLSFMCESYKDIEGRYDTQRGRINNNNTSNLNFNVYNKAYENENNYFTYRIPYWTELPIVSRPNQIVYSLSKTLGEETDTWTNIQLASILDLDGDKGELTALRRLNNDIVAFQQKGISKVLYNESVQISSTTGVPIEIANSGKVQGKRYLSDTLGCYNKWNICSTPNGLYFIDSITQDIYFIGESLSNLSLAKGFHTVVKKDFSSTKSWNPNDWDSNITLYDPTTRDVMFINSTSCLVYNEAIGEFTSFYDYGGINTLGTLDNISLVSKQGENSAQLWRQRSGNYGQFFDKYKPYWIKYLLNPEPTVTKIFNNLEISADSFDNNGKLLAQEAPFDLLQVSNEYQDTGEVGLGMFRTPSNLKRKFRSWRVTIPRDSVYTRDRIRNKWTFLTLKKKCTLGQGINRTVLHNILVDYCY